MWTPECLREPPPPITSNVFNVAGATVHDAMLSLDDAHRISRKTFTAVTAESMRKTWGEEAHEHR